MSDIVLPKHITEKLEQRWASRLAREASLWRYNRSVDTDTRPVIDRKGRLVPVSFKRAPLHGRATDLAERIL